MTIKIMKSSFNKTDQNESKMKIKKAEINYSHAKNIMPGTYSYNLET